MTRRKPPPQVPRRKPLLQVLHRKSLPQAPHHKSPLQAPRRRWPLSKSPLRAFQQVLHAARPLHLPLPGKTSLMSSVQPHLPLLRQMHVPLRGFVSAPPHLPALLLWRSAPDEALHDEFLPNSSVWLRYHPAHHCRRKFLHHRLPPHHTQEPMPQRPPDIPWKEPVPSHLCVSAQEAASSHHLLCICVRGPLFCRLAPAAAVEYPPAGQDLTFGTGRFVPVCAVWLHPFQCPPAGHAVLSHQSPEEWIRYLPEFAVPASHRWLCECPFGSSPILPLPRQWKAAPRPLPPPRRRCMRHALPASHRQVHIPRLHSAAQQQKAFLLRALWAPPAQLSPALPPEWFSLL